MWKNRHLKGAPKARVNENGEEVVEIGSQGKGILEENEFTITQVPWRHEESP